MEPCGISSDDFAYAMAAFAPFEPAPAIAVAVSGGPDSMALTLLLDGWARSRGGSVLGLTVDHGLRPESAAEARQVGAWLALRGVAHQTLNWDGDKPRAGIQSAARAARYRLLGEACARRGVLHLAVAHHADDQAETVLFRRDRRSGGDGLAGMAAARSLGPVRLLRPLLGWRKPALIAVCAAFGQPWIDDPSNRAPSHARTELRRRLARDPGLRDAILAGAQGAALLRADRERLLAALLGRIAEVRPDGAVILDPDALSSAPPDLRRAALAAALRTAGGGAYAPSPSAIERLDRALGAESFAGVSLGGCVVRRWRGRLLLCREPGRAAPETPLLPDRWTLWDGRFSLRIASPDPAPMTGGALGAAAFAELRAGIANPPPAIVGAGLPAVRAEGRVIAVPALGWSVKGAPAVEQRLQPLWPLCPERFTVVYAGHDIIFDDGGQACGVGSIPVRSL
jgi:tRNA(Ile)-lysidine synthase